jgi:hypothetical protein
VIIFLIVYPFRWFTGTIVHVNWISRFEGGRTPEDGWVAILSHAITYLNLLLTVLSFPQGLKYICLIKMIGYLWGAAGLCRVAWLPLDNRIETYDQQ